MLNKLFRRKKAPADPKEAAEKERQRQEALRAQHRADAKSANQHNYAGLR
jgi:hypothetical protein